VVLLCRSSSRSIHSMTADPLKSMMVAEAYFNVSWFNCVGAHPKYTLSRSRPSKTCGYGWGELQVLMTVLCRSSSRSMQFPITYVLNSMIIVDVFELLKFTVCRSVSTKTHSPISYFLIPSESYDYGRGLFELLMNILCRASSTSIHSPITNFIKHITMAETCFRL